MNIRSLITLALCGVATSVAAQPYSTDELHQLSRAPGWRALLHCSGDQESRCNSEVTSPDFFLSSERTLEEELRSTINAFLQPGEKGTEARCRFPARYEWIQSNLRERLPTVTQPCGELDEWMKVLNPAGVTVIFPSSFLNNPASAFGHTLLRIDQPDQDERTRLLAYSASFSANTQGEPAIIYAFRGVFGGYDGLFSVAPYYKKVTDYSDLENRDIWEYQLTLTPAEARTMALHLWELRKVKFSYYYFDENCSYQLLSLLELARPSLRLSTQFPAWVIPVDTVRAIVEEVGLVSSITFRPSLSTKLRNEIAAATPVEVSVARMLSDGGAEPQVDTTADTLDLAYDMLTYRRVRRRSDTQEERERAWKILNARSKIGGLSRNTERVPAIRPEQGHPSAKVALGIGAERGRLFSEYLLRPALHDQLDPGGGYLPGAQIRFFEMRFRNYPTRPIRLEEFTPIDVESFTPRDSFFKAISWRVGFGSSEAQLSPETRGQQLALKLGGGLATNLWDGGMAYALLDSTLAYSRRWSEEHSLAFGPRVGFMTNNQRTVAFRADISALRAEVGEKHSKFEVSAEARVSLTPRFALRVRESNVRDFDRSSNAVSVSLEYFFSPMGPLSKPL